MSDLAKVLAVLGLIGAGATLYHAAQTGKWKDGHTLMAALSVASFVLSAKR